MSVETPVDDVLPGYVPSPVDTTNPVSICDRLAEIEDEVAFISNELARAAYWRKKYSKEIETLTLVFYAQTSGTIPERKAQVGALIAGDNGRLPDKLASAEANYAKFNALFEGRDTQRSILQSILKTHGREQDPRFGEGSHHR